jgi:hypothetical protein
MLTWHNVWMARHGRALANAWRPSAAPRKRSSPAT